MLHLVTTLLLQQGRALRCAHPADVLELACRFHADLDLHVANMRVAPLTNRAAGCTQASALKKESIKAPRTSSPKLHVLIPRMLKYKSKI